MTNKPPSRASFLSARWIADDQSKNSSDHSIERFLFFSSRESLFSEFPRAVTKLLLSSVVLLPCFWGIGFLPLACLELPLRAEAIFFFFTLHAEAIFFCM
ncbi:MAG TPA: hypothetical protein VE970_00225 [Pseudolabrys sp.]|nr:hypothetical protein [Pseudolabrys sp.]